jgi:hypothetical protein
VAGVDLPRGMIESEDNRSKSMDFIIIIIIIIITIITK